MRFCPVIFSRAEPDFHVPSQAPDHDMGIRKNADKQEHIMNDMEEKFQGVIDYFEEITKDEELSEENLRVLEIAVGVKVKPIDMDAVRIAINTLRSTYARIGLVRGLMEKSQAEMERVRSRPATPVKIRRKRRTKAEMEAARAAGRA